MFNHNLIKRSLVVGLTATAVAFPAVAQAEWPADSGGVQSAVQVPVTGPQPDIDRQPGIDRLQSNAQQWFAAQGRFVAASPSTPATVVGPTDASSGGYVLPASVVSTTAEPGSSFHWGDAGIGAGSAIVLLGASGLGMAAMRRRRPEHTLAS
jgi:hypothetical protein